MGSELRIRPRRRCAEGARESGFALALVVLLLFAILAAGAAGYRVVRMEADQSEQAQQNLQALAVAQGGLQWFTASHSGAMPDSAVHMVNGGTAVIVPRKLATLSMAEDLFLITSRGMFTDRRRQRVSSVRTVSRYAVLRKLPGHAPLAPLVTTSGRVRVRETAVVDGSDHASAGQCPGAPAGPIAGVVARSTVQALAGGTIVGVPESVTFGSFAKLVEAAGVPWSVYADPEFPAEYDDAWPDYSYLSPAAFPVVRVNGDFSADAGKSGWGALVVTGTLRIPPGSTWGWQGIVLAGDLQDFPSDSDFTIDGMLLAGQGDAMDHLEMNSGTIRYHSCYVARAGDALAHLTLVDSGWWETI